MALFGLGVAVLTWDPLLVSPAPGLDPSWVLGLNLAAADGLDHGTEIVFTYGPLGFLQEPLAIDGLLATLGAIYTLALRTALGATLYYAARRSLPWPAAAGVAVLAAMITPREIAPLTLTAVWCLVALHDPVPRWAPRLVVLGGGALAGLEVLVKLNVGVTILVLVSITALALPGPRLRNLATLLAAFAVTCAVLWLAGGQGIGNADDYVSSSFEVISGYSEAMQLELPKASWDWWAALIAGIGAVATAALATAAMPARRRLTTALVGALLVMALFKFGFVRHDASHVGVYFGGLAAIWLGLRWRGTARLVPVVAIAALTLVYINASDELDDGALRPADALDDLATLLLPGERADAIDEAKAAMRNSYGLDPAIVARVGESSVDVRPWEIGVAWAYGLEWRPLPVLQDYQAYTPELDRLNAGALASSEGPRYVLRHIGFGDSPSISIDGRFGSYDVPQQTMVLLCRFQPVAAASSYQLLERSQDRCGEPRELGNTKAAYGETVAIPDAADGEAVFAKVEGAAPEGIERLRTLFFRAAERRIELRIGTARLVPGNAESGLLLFAPPGTDFPAPNQLAPNTETFAIDSQGGPLSSDGPLEIEFYAVRVRALGAAN